MSESGGPDCACILIEARVDEKDGKKSNRWICRSCGAEFVRLPKLGKFKVDLSKFEGEVDISVPIEIPIVEDTDNPNFFRHESSPHGMMDLDPGFDILSSLNTKPGDRIIVYRERLADGEKR
jgi:hypothetical protein